MKIAVIGTGYVGLVSGTCFAESGNDVGCVDIDQTKIERLRNGEVPIYEPGLGELIERNIASGRLQFTTAVSVAVPPAQLVYLAVGTPMSESGAADLSALWSVVDSVAPYLNENAITVTKSTVPVGTNAQIFARLKQNTGRDCRVASNPEFLKEGAAIDDFMKPDRVVVGVRSAEDGEVLRRLYAPFLRTEKPFLTMSPESAEMTKYVANALLATKISFINEMSGICSATDANIDDVRRGIGHDSRIGFSFLFPGVGYGGSCFPKDVRALDYLAKSQSIDAQILQAVDRVNGVQKELVPTLISNYFKNDLVGKKIGVWGLAFKPKTDDIREAPALVLIDRLLDAGCELVVHDPEAMSNVCEKYGDRLTYCDRPLDTLNDVDALAIMTEWGEFRTPDFAEMKSRMKQAVVFDGRNLFNGEQMQSAGFTYYSIGRPTIQSSDN